MRAHLCDLATDQESIVQRVQLLTLRQLIGRTNLCSVSTCCRVVNV